MKNLFLGNTELKIHENSVEGQFVEMENEKFYKISNYNQMPDFFMTIVSDSDHWMYLSSNGSLSAGRKNRDNALFPYYTVDKIHDYKGLTGSKTCCIVEESSKHFLWEPFSAGSERIYQIQRNIYKSIYGNKVIFEEANIDLGLSFQYGWYNSEKFGWIKKSNICNLGTTTVKVEILDGIRNILPSGVDYAFQSEYSNLLDAYKKNELLDNSKLGLFMLSAIPVDRAEPSEALKATTVWSHTSARNANYLISDKQVENFCNGMGLATELDIRGARGAYYIHAEYELAKEEKAVWYMVAEVNQDGSKVANLDAFINNEKNCSAALEEDIKAGTNKLIKIVANADGLQLGNEKLSFARHFSNTLFNAMRGGIYTDNYRVNVSDLALYVKQCNSTLFHQFKAEIGELPNKVDYSTLINWAKKQANQGIERICYEYLPLTFSRRHGDPSRPWNQFSIEVKNDDGSDKLNYQGNWRDIFQNWEALNYSFPEYIEGIIGKFLNASTADGYNPYRITREGIDWEKPDPNDPWAYIGYWGDHQIIYLQKFLEQSNNLHPGKIDELLTKDIFVFANVPYRIKGFDEMVANPKDTIVFDHNLNAEIEKIADEIGSDGRLLQDNKGNICRTNLTEKVLVTLLAKLSNFIPEAGIWLNTQRPEWNDANNALVGNGVSMVTLYYIRRFLKFWQEKFSSTRVEEVQLSAEINLFYTKVFSIFRQNIDQVEVGFSDEKRFEITSALGMAGTDFRTSIYTNSFSGEKVAVNTKQLAKFTALCLRFVDQSIAANKRKDGLYHSYNLVSFKKKSISIRYLYEMLEGQVAVLSSGYLSTSESLNVLDALKTSTLFREDQYSYILYPNRQLPRFIEKNNIPQEFVKQSELLQKLISLGNKSIVSKDEQGNFHFNSAFRNATILEEALNNLPTEVYAAQLEQEKEAVLGLYEEIFDHQSFTGRSGTFFAYEGLGSIYWHMVSKLLLATQECYFKGISAGASDEVTGRLKAHYYEIKAGIGMNKSPELYGAFPTDAYSHTPANAGAKQPGLTGQVKEDIITRFGELGIQVLNGEINFLPVLLNPAEILTQTETFNYVDLSGTNKTMDLSDRQLAFTFCQVPVVYTFGKNEKVVVVFANGSIKELNGNILPKEISTQLFKRNGEIERVEFYSPFINSKRK